ncbi:vacuolar protein-sorting-associated protein 11 homolog [Carica papaya]|uniref:vacuolar protein-sorting-associated protein 11 homolog n=1 Tax=Carica papaya TaxID=3649 RepID=UPI000B8CCF20|nr:vacuolar protein-sorting-associated protein 11 homolog [Carica papaya]
MYQWRKFEFFEDKYGAKCTIPDEVRGKVECCSSGRGKVVIGCDDGTVSLLDRGLKFNFGFQAHSSSVLFLQHLKQRNFLVTVGEDERISPQQSAMCLKVFDLDKMQPEGTSTTTPDCIGILRIFTNQFPEAKITSFLVLEEAPPILLIAIGLDNGCIYCIKGDIARERITRFKLQVDNISDKNQSPVTGLGFRLDGQVLLLFAVTPNSVVLFNMHNQPPKRQTLDHIGCNVNSVTMSDRSELIIGRPEAVYFYEVDGRGPCWAFEGEKKFLGWFRGYLLCVIADQRNGKNTFNIYDLKNRLIAHSLIIKEVSHMLCEWGNIILIMTDKSALCIGEKDMESKLDMLFKKNLYTVAINLYDEALQYISSLEPSQAGVTVKEYGKILIEHKPVETIDILMRLCTEDGDSAKRGTSTSSYLSMLPSPVDFLNIFIHHPQSLMDFLEKYTNKVKDSPAQVEIHNTLLELYLSNDLNFPSISQAQNGVALGLKARSGAVAMSKEESNGIAANNKDSYKEKDQLERLQKGLHLLKSAWPSDLEHPLYDVDLAIILCEMNAFRDGLLYLYEKLKLYKEVIACYMQAHDHEGLIACCKRLGDSGKGGDPSLWADLLKYFGELGEDCSKEVKEVLTYVEREDILPPIVVLQTLSRNPCLTLSVIKDYIARKLEQESKLIEEDRRAIDKYQEETSAMKKEIQDLRTNARIFQLSKCTACTFTLDLPAVHFLCMHSFHQRCLGDNEKECPECAPEYRSVLEKKRNLENSRDQDRFFQQVKSSKDGFSVIAEYFGKGIISKTSPGSTGSLRSGGTSSGSGF